MKLDLKPDMVQTHNMEKEGYHPDDVGEVVVGGKPGRWFGIWTRKRFNHESVKGRRVWVVIAQGQKPRRYSLGYMFYVDGVESDPDGAFFVYGKNGYGFRRDKEPLLDQQEGWFKKLYDQKRNFSVGFSAIDDYAAGEFEAILEQNRPKRSRRRSQKST